MNPRYRKDAQIGSTRRSSASLKPKRESGGGSRPAPKSKAADRTPYVDPPEVKKWRRLWAALLALAIVPVIYVIGPNVAGWAGLGKGWPVNESVAKWGLYVEMAALAGALYIDFAIIRKIQTAARKAQKDGGKRSEKDAS